MHWSEQLAQQIIARNPDKEEYVCAAGISPSGSIHIGNFRDVATSYFVVRALRKMGRKAKLLFSWDEFDRLRKVPVNVAAVDDNMEQYIGYPYIDVPNPFPGSEHANYAKYFEEEFMESIRAFGIDMDCRYQAEMYRSGKYVKYILLALQKRGEIFDILDQHRTQEAQPGEREAYYPVSIYCPHCHRDTTKIVSLSEDCQQAHYTCKCGHSGDFNFTTDFNCKLAWKVDWPMRWLYEGVDFEPGGRDHASPNGSYDTSKEIAKAIFDCPAPLFQGYDFIGLKGSTAKMSGSSGLNLTPATLLKLYQPEVILWLYSRYDPLKAFDFCFDNGILRQYSEFDTMYKAVEDGTADEYTKGVMYNTTVPGRTIYPVSMSNIVQFGSAVDFNESMLEIVFEKIKTPYKYEQFADRLDRAKYWLEVCSPESVNRVRTGRNWEVYNQLDADLRREVSILYDYIAKGGYTLDDLFVELYAIPKQVFGFDLPEKELKARQRDFFKTVYLLLISKERGPRLYLFLFAIETEKYLHLLDFSTPKTAEEAAAETASQAEGAAAQASESAEAQGQAAASAQKAKVYGDPDPVQPVLPEISLEQFDTVDLRVCQIIRAQEIRKSNNCLKLTLNDGNGQRVIVSSIKHDYTCEELVGKKIIVVANLASTRITGVTSQGMLLAATNNACGCQVLFVDDIVPVGTRIH